MKIIFINPPNGFYDTTYLAPPLGLLTLASFVRPFGYDVEVIDLNLEMFADPKLDGRDFYKKVSALVLEKKPDVVGFTSMCLESHVSLEIARRIKAANPRIATIFGGTHFGAIAKEVLENFDFADFVILGEGEQAFLMILDKLNSRGSVLPENVVYRHKGKILKGILEAKTFPLEEIPFPAYDLVKLERYFELNPSHLFNYEAGRGCVFKCAFCYSPFHYGDAVRHKSSERIVEELQRLVDMGAKHIFFVQDNFLNSPRWASEVCRKIAEADLPLTWECYTTYPQLKAPVADLLAESGCIGVFTGIDAVSISSQKRMNKPFLKNWENTSDKLAYCLEKKILPICAFILEEPNQAIDQIESTIYTALECVRLGCEIHLNTLSLYNNTSLAKNLSELNFAYSTIKPDLLLDTPSIVQNNEFAKILPNLFPYHSTYCKVKDWEIFTAKAHMVLTLIQLLTQTLYQFVVNEGKSIWKVLDFLNTDFVKWIRDINPLERHEAVVFEFAKYFASKKLSSQTKLIFHKELANIFLSNRKKERFVTFTTEGNEFEAELAWFVNLKMFDDLAKHKMLNSLVRRKTLFNNSPEFKEKEYKVAFLTKQNKVQFYSIPLDLWKILSKLERASISQKTVKLNQEEKNIVTENNWIYLVS